jgi:regulator of protease activity HflC (stomatin/prohibitin superfamily)
MNCWPSARRSTAIIDEQTEHWGVQVTAVETKDVELPMTMQRAVAKQVEAEREKRAKVIHAQGELLDPVGSGRRSDRRTARYPVTTLPTNAD